jgi:hypothetical protein
VAFYGESYAVNDVSGPVDYDSVFLHHDGTSSTVSAGQSFMALSQADSLIFDDLVAETDVVVSWVVETGPGSDGSLSCTSGLDPTWSLDPASVTQDAGTLSATGAGTLVFPQTVITHDALISFDDGPTALFECVSGVVEVQQIKLRVWPAAGVGGTWTAGPVYNVTRTALDRDSLGVGYVSGFYADPADAWVETRAGIDALIGTTVSYASGILSGADGQFGVFPDTSGTSGGYFGQAGFATKIVYPQERTLSRFTVPVSAGVDPKETRYEPTGSVRVAGMPDTQAFEQWTGWVGGDRITSATTGLRIGIEILPDVPDFGPDGEWPFIFATGNLTVVPPEGLVPPSAPVFCFMVVPSEYYTFGDNTYPNGQATISPDFSYNAVAANYEYYDPEAVPTPELSPRFYVKDLAGGMRPVGFGKPGTETAVFKVPTAVGMFRDLTTAEYATYGPDARPPGGYPLKVKRYDVDGNPWWDHVAWMVPETE